MNRMRVVVAAVVGAVVAARLGGHHDQGTPAIAWYRVPATCLLHRHDEVGHGQP